MNFKGIATHSPKPNPHQASISLYDRKRHLILALFRKDKISLLGLATSLTTSQNSWRVSRERPMNRLWLPHQQSRRIETGPGLNLMMMKTDKFNNSPNSNSSCKFHSNSTNATYPPTSSNPTLPPNLANSSNNPNAHLNLSLIPKLIITNPHSKTTVSSNRPPKVSQTSLHALKYFPNNQDHNLFQIKASTRNSNWVVRSWGLRNWTDKERICNRIWKVHR